LQKMSVMHTNIHTKTRLMTTPTTVAVVVKDIAIPLHGWTGLEGSRSLRFPDFKTIGT